MGRVGEIEVSQSRKRSQINRSACASSFKSFRKCGLWLGAILDGAANTRLKGLHISSQLERDNLIGFMVPHTLPPWLRVWRVFGA